SSVHCTTYLLTHSALIQNETRAQDASNSDCSTFMAPLRTNLCVNATRKLSKCLASTIAWHVIDDYAQWIVHVPITSDVLAAIDLHQAH
ncbi:MAG: hypothetical protein ACREXY_03280, partial [Gammaproteobacteria bacterium]